MSYSPTVKEISEAGSKMGTHPNGRHCVFIALNDKWGIKLYCSRMSRHDAYERQKEVYEWGYAPAVGEVIDLPSFEDMPSQITSSKLQYGYITEIVTCCRETIIEEAGGDTHGSHYGAVEERWKEKTRKQRQAARQFMLQNDYNYYDDWSANWGVTKDGRLVAIDFGA